MKIENFRETYPESQDKPDFPKIELEILDFWDRDETFKASVEMRPKKTASGESNEFVFYDGPPFANGLPHYGHLLTGFVKDVIPRFWTMMGKRVERRFGWDCHGLPVEMNAEQELGKSGKKEIEQFGIENFNSYCRNLVNSTTDIWRSFVRRQARWVDMDNSYRTMDITYMESVMWAFKTLYEKGFIYEGFRVLPYCWECETPLSNFETHLDDAYRIRTDPAVTVKVKARTTSPVDNISPFYLLIWTTTPWTLPSNLAIAVNPEVQYSVIETDSHEHFVIAKELLEENSQILGKTKVLKDIMGSSLVGLKYEPIFDYFKDVESAFQVVGASFVTTEEGTGLVHLAPGFGEDDQLVCQENNIEVVCPVDERGRFTEEVKDFEGLNVFEANEKIINQLKEKALLINQEAYEHSYPHCWRTDTALIYKAVSSWFVAVTKFKEELLKLNEEIDWIPPHIKHGSFGNWLKNARDWSISRNRFWGSPIPIWKSTDPRYPRVEVYGSIKELEEAFNVKIEDLHRPAIDQLERPNPDDPTGQSKMTRVKDVLDCWFESGSMPFASIHFPFENADWFEKHFPADFIVEYVAQVRGWFYTLHVLATSLFNKPPFKQCLTHGVILGNDGRKLSKRLKNFPDPEEVFSKFGADAMRWFLISGPGLTGQDFIIDENGFLSALKQVLNPLYNSWHFLSLYSNADGMKGRFTKCPSAVLDRYILAKTASLATEVSGALKASNLPKATSVVGDFLDALTNWYIRRSRERFWNSPQERTGSEDKQQAYDTLHTTLELATKILAPMLPLTCEYIFKNLTGRRSVHLENWPSDEELYFDHDLVKSMDIIRQICSLGHSIRKKNMIRARQPLRQLLVVTDNKSLISPYVNLIQEELNVKEVVFTSNFDEIAEQKLAVNPAAIGPRFLEKTPQIISAAKRGDYKILPNHKILVASEELGPDEAWINYIAKNDSNTRFAENGRLGIQLSLDLDRELILEGFARDIVRQIQNARKQANLAITDRIEVELLTNSADLTESLTKFKDFIASQVLANNLILNSERITDADYSETSRLSGQYELLIKLKKP